MADPSYISGGVLEDGEAWVGLATTTVAGTSTATITFKSGFDSTDTDVGGVQAWDQYMDLVLICYAAGEAVGGSNASYVQFNSDTASNYDYQWFYGNAGSVTAASGTTDKIYCDSALGTASPQPWGTGVFTMFDINSGKYKSTQTQAGGELATVGMTALYTGTWKSQAAVNRIDIACGFDYLPGSMFSLFGVLPRMVT